MVNVINLYLEVVGMLMFYGAHLTVYITRKDDNRGKPVTGAAVQVIACTKQGCLCIYNIRFNQKKRMTVK